VNVVWEQWHIIVGDLTVFIVARLLFSVYGLLAMGEEVYEFIFV